MISTWTSATSVAVVVEVGESDRIQRVALCRDWEYKEGRWTIKERGVRLSTVSEVVAGSRERGRPTGERL